MKKFKWWILIPVVVLAILFVPVKRGPYDDGGTVVYSALTYKVVDWKSVSYPPVKGRRVYIFPENFKSLRELHRVELEDFDWDSFLKRFRATIIELTETAALVEPLEGEEERNACDRFSINIEDLGAINAKMGDKVEIVYTGEIMESYPAQIRVASWSLVLEDAE